jgi:hypothetical protein
MKSVILLINEEVLLKRQPACIQELKGIFSAFA